MPSSSHVEGDIIDVACGLLKGKLHKNKFYCPGIHRECIEQPDGKFVSPKMFTIMGEKERLKDWKNAVRINGLQLRRYIDSGQLDFYRHDEYCTGRCVARTPIAYVNGDKPATQTSQSLTNRRRPCSSSWGAPGEFPAEKKLIRSPVPKVEFVGSINEHTYCHLPDDSERLEQQDVKPDVTMLQNFLQRKSESFTKIIPVERRNLNDNKSTTAADNPLSPEMIKFPIELLPLDGANSSFAEDKNFWMGIMEFGLLDVFLADIKEHISILRRDLVTSGLPEDCNKLSVIVRALGLMDKFKRKMSTYKHNMEKQEAKLEREMEALKSQVAIFERRKEALKKKSEKFKTLLQINTKTEPGVAIQKHAGSEDESGIRTSAVGNTVDVLVKQDDEPMETVNVKNEKNIPETIKMSPTSKSKSFIKKVLLTNIPSDQSNDLKQVSVTIERLKQCLEKNKKISNQSSTSTAGSTVSITEKSVYIPQQVSSSQDAPVMRFEPVSERKDVESSSVTSSSEPSGTVTSASTSEEMMKTSDLSSCVREDFYEDTDGRPRPKRFRLTSTIQKTNSVVTGKLRDKLKLNFTGSDSEGESIDEHTSDVDMVNESKKMEVATVEKKPEYPTTEKKLEDHTTKKKPEDPPTKDAVDQVVPTPYYGHKQKTVTEIIVSKEVAEKAKHILRATDLLPDDSKKTDKKVDKTPGKKTQKERTDDGANQKVEEDLGAKTEISCQTPLDGIREKSVDSNRSVVASRRSSRKTPHLFTWGSKIDIVKKVL